MVSIAQEKFYPHFALILTKIQIVVVQNVVLDNARFEDWFSGETTLMREGGGVNLMWIDNIRVAHIGQFPL